MGEIILATLVGRDPALASTVRISSAGTAPWHVGEPMDRRARRALDRANFELPGSRAAYADGEYLDGCDLVLVMTDEHRRDLRSRGTGDHDIRLWRELSGGGVVEDPYYEDQEAFDRCLGVLSREGPLWIAEFRRRWGGVVRAV